MMAHEILRAAAKLVETGWSKGCDARDATGRQVPLFTGSARASVNPAAVYFSPYAAIVKVAQGGIIPQAIWVILASLASSRTGSPGGRNHVHPLQGLNELEDVTHREVIEILTVAADELDPAMIAVTEAHRTDDEAAP